MESAKEWLMSGSIIIHDPAQRSSGLPFLLKIGSAGRSNRLKPKR
nr:hypothetical protein [Bacillus licheniformis]